MQCGDCKKETKEGTLKEGILRCTDCTYIQYMKDCGYSDCDKCQGKLCRRYTVDVKDYTFYEGCSKCGYHNSGHLFPDGEN